MKILHIVGFLNLPKNPEEEGASGVVRTALEIARMQVNSGHEVWVSSATIKPWQSQWHGVKLMGLRLAPWARVHWIDRELDFRAHIPLMMLTLNEKFDIVHGHLYIYLRFLRSKARIAHFHGNPYEGNINNDMRQSDMNLVIRTSDAQIAVSQFIAKQLKQGFGDRGNIQIVPNGVDLARFNRRDYKKVRDYWRILWNVNDNDVVFLFAGAITPEKGIIYLARTFVRLVKELPQTHLVIAGSTKLWVSTPSNSRKRDDYKREVQEVLNSSTTRSRVHFLGQLGASQMPGVYSASDIVVLPSIVQEAFPLTVLEAFASGKTVIASNVGALPELITGQNGLLTPPRDEVALQVSMQRLAMNVNERERFANVAEQTAQNFSWATTVNKLDSIYKFCLSKK